MKQRLHIGLLILGALAAIGICAVALPGCATSAGFQSGAYAAAPVLADDAANYVNFDATLDAATKATRLAEAAQLKNDTAALTKISAPQVASDWAAVRPWLLAYFAADPLMKADPDLAALKNDVAGRLDAVIASEQSRPFAPPMPAMTQPSP